MGTVRGPEAGVEHRVDTRALPVVEQTRARYPDEDGFVERDGVRVHWERYGDGDPTFLLLPTWTIVHARHWKGQIPYLARHFRVVTFDGRGNGRSDRPQVTAAYDSGEFIEDAVAVLDATGTDRTIVAGMSMGGGYALRMAAEHPERVLGAVMVGASVPFGVPRTGPDADFEAEPPADAQGWAQYNAHVWRRDWLGFVDWFFNQVYSESHSTKQIEDAVLWASETDPETMIVAERSPWLRPPAAWTRPANEAYTFSYTRRVRCPCLVVHGTGDLITPIATGRRLAEALGADLVELDGSGHNPLGREPVLMNLLLARFARECVGGES
jgi:pimeloyl-ACP methyl ester carboxylesterase